MTPDELRVLLGRLGLTQTEAARVLWTDPRSVRRWCAGEREVSGPAQAMLTLFDELASALPMARVIADNRRSAAQQRADPGARAPGGA